MCFRRPVPGFLQGTSNWIGTKSTHSDLRKDTFKVDYLINPIPERLSVRGTNTPCISTLRRRYLGRMEEVLSRPNRIGAASLTSTLSPTFINEFTFLREFRRQGRHPVWELLHTTCLRTQYGLSYPFLYPGTKIAPDKVPVSASRADHPRCRTLSGLLVGFRLWMDQH